MSFCGGSWQTLDSDFLGSIHAHYLLAIQYLEGYVTFLTSTFTLVKWGDNHFLR